MRLDVDEHEPQVLLSAALGLCLFVSTLGLAACSSTPSTSGIAARLTCPSGDPLLGIYDPKRLTVLKPCQTVTGTVLEVEGRSDGDTHVLLRPDGGFTKFLNVENVNTGGLVVEIVPGQDLPAPTVGQHVSVFGTWVLDEHNGWNEIHPVWAITYLDRGATSQAMPPASPLYGGDQND